MEKHVGTAKRSVIIKADVETVWKKLSKITKLDWLEEQKSSKFLSQKKYGVGAIRLISFEDGSDVEEHVVDSSGRVKVTWQSYFVSDKKKKEFLEFSKFLNQFYTKSLHNLKSNIQRN